MHSIFFKQNVISKNELYDGFMLFVRNFLPADLVGDEASSGDLSILLCYCSFRWTINLCDP